MIEYLEREDIINLLNTHPSDLNIIIDKNIVGKNNLIDVIYRGIESDYTDHSWDGVDEALQDMCWLSDRTVRVVHLDLPDLQQHDLEVYMSVIKDADESWHGENRKEWSYPANFEVHFIFAEDLKDKVEAILSRL